MEIVRRHMYNTLAVQRSYLCCCQRVTYVLCFCPSLLSIMAQSRLLAFGRLGGRSLPSLILFCVMRLFSNHVLICFHWTGCFSPSPSSAVADVVLRICLYKGNLPDALAKTSGVIERDPTPRATAAGEIGVELDVKIVVLGGDD